MENDLANFPLASITQLLALIALGIYVIFTAVLYYHWEAFATDQAIARTTYTIYLVTTVPLVITLLAVSYFGW